MENVKHNVKVQIEILRVQSGAYNHPNLHKTIKDYTRGFDPSLFGPKPNRAD